MSYRNGCHVKFRCEFAAMDKEAQIAGCRHYRQDFTFEKCEGRSLEKDGDWCLMPEAHKEVVLKSWGIDVDKLIKNYNETENKNVE